MKEITGLKARFFSYKEYEIETIEKEDMYEVWYCEEYAGEKLYLFGLPKKHRTEEGEVELTMEKLLELAAGHIDARDLPPEEE